MPSTATHSSIQLPVRPVAMKHSDEQDHTIDWLDEDLAELAALDSSAEQGKGENVAYTPTVDLAQSLLGARPKPVATISSPLLKNLAQETAPAAVNTSQPEVQPEIETNNYDVPAELLNNTDVSEVPPSILNNAAVEEAAQEEPQWTFDDVVDDAAETDMFAAPIATSDTDEEQSPDIIYRAQAQAHGMSDMEEEVEAFTWDEAVEPPRLEELADIRQDDFESAQPDLEDEGADIFAANTPEPQDAPAIITKPQPQVQEKAPIITAPAPQPQDTPAAPTQTSADGQSYRYQPSPHGGKEFVIDGFNPQVDRLKLDIGRLFFTFTVLNGAATLVFSNQDKVILTGVSDVNAVMPTLVWL